MGDRCYVSGSVLKKDWPRFKEIAGLSEPREDLQEEALCNCVRFEEDECNYGLYPACEQAAKEGLTFLAYNSAGSSYGAGVTVGLKGRFYAADTVGDFGSITVQLRDDAPEVAEPSLAHAVATWHAERACREILDTLEPTVGGQPPTDADYIAEARDRYASDDVNVDDDAAVSRGEGGAFVAAWVWVPAPDDADEDSF